MIYLNLLKSPKSPEISVFDRVRRDTKITHMLDKESGLHCAFCPLRSQKPQFRPLLITNLVVGTRSPGCPDPVHASDAHCPRRQGSAPRGGLGLRVWAVRDQLLRTEMGGWVRVV